MKSELKLLLLLLLQVVHDGEQLRVVPGGFASGALVKSAKWKQQFNSTGEFKFAVGGLRCAPLTVMVGHTIW